MNFDKFAIMFCSNTGDMARHDVMTTLDIVLYIGSDKYLGMPLIFGRSKKLVLRDIHECISAKVKRWQGGL